jgi:ubiquitin-like protein Pup
MPRTTERKPTKKGSDTATETGDHEQVTLESIDKLLDEIDLILETNVLETIRMFVQKGGQ